MQNRGRNLFFFCTLFSCALLIFFGCINPFSPQIDDGSLTGELITDQATPEEVLTNFRYAYTFRDSLLYTDLLDSAFVFQYFDPDQGPSGLFISWTRETELKTTGQLLRTFDIINLEWVFTRYDTTDAATDAIEQIEAKSSFRLDLSSSDFNFTVSGFAIFTFRLNQSDNKWRIVRWVDQSDL